MKFVLSWATALRTILPLNVDDRIEPHSVERAHTNDRLKGIVMAIGTVKFFNTTKGFGFIQPEDGGNDVFVHISAVERSGMTTLNEGQKVSFEVVQDRRSGKSAADNLSAV